MTSLRAGLAVAPGILARPVDVEGVMGMLDRRHGKPRDTSSGISAVINVVLPLPLQPARPKIRIVCLILAGCSWGAERGRRNALLRQMLGFPAVDRAAPAADAPCGAARPADSRIRSPRSAARRPTAAPRRSPRPAESRAGIADDQDADRDHLDRPSSIWPAARPAGRRAARRDTRAGPRPGSRGTG